MADDAKDWYYTPSTGEVTRGKQSGWDDRMGPYASEAEARAARIVGLTQRGRG